MSKKSRAIRKVTDRDQCPTTVVKDPADVIVIIPYLLGFDPTDSVVVVSLEGPRQRFGPCFRLDLAEAEDAAQQVSDIVGLVARLGGETVLVVAFSNDSRRADPVVRGACAELTARGVIVKEALRADGRRWWSYTCGDPGCCSPDGAPYDTDTARVAAEAVLAGMQRLPHRNSLRLQFEPVAARRQALEAARQETDLSPMSKGQFSRLLTAGLEDPVSLSDPDLLRLATAVQRVGLRDLAWVTMSRDDSAAHLALWAHVMRCVPDDLLAPVGSLAAFAAWLQGTGVLASHAIDRVLAAYPRYSMAGLIARILQSGINPRRWDDMRTGGLAFSPESGSMA